VLLQMIEQGATFEELEDEHLSELFIVHGPDTADDVIARDELERLGLQRRLRHRAELGSRDLEGDTRPVRLVVCLVHLAATAAPAKGADPITSGDQESGVGARTHVPATAVHAIDNVAVAAQSRPRTQALIRPLGEESTRSRATVRYLVSAFISVSQSVPTLGRLHSSFRRKCSPASSPFRPELRAVVNQ
jgi:hypothetical protein